MIGLLALTRSFDRPGSWLIGQAAVVSAMVGLAIFGVESTSAKAWPYQNWPTPLRKSTPLNASIDRAAHAVAAATTDPLSRRWR